MGGGKPAKRVGAGGVIARWRDVCGRRHTCFLGTNCTFWVREVWKNSCGEAVASRAGSEGKTPVPFRVQIYTPPHIGGGEQGAGLRRRRKKNCIREREESDVGWGAGYGYTHITEAVPIRTKGRGGVGRNDRSQLWSDRRVFSLASLSCRCDQERLWAFSISGEGGPRGEKEKVFAGKRTRER